MRVLLDTNIIIYREGNKTPKEEIGILFKWLDQLGCKKCIHPETLNEIRNYKDPLVVKAFETKTANYHQLETIAPSSPEFLAIHQKHDKNKNDKIDTMLLNEVFCDRIDILITEDRKMHHKAREFKISEKVFTIDSFLEKVTVENPKFADYKVLSVKKELFGNLNLEDTFFDSFRRDYHEFNTWFNRKSEETAYVCFSETKSIVAFLYLKVEDSNEYYPDITPSFSQLKRLKIGTFKVILNGYKLGERFLKIIFDNALQFKVSEIYVTLFNKTMEQERLTNLLLDWGFSMHGSKKTKNGEEDVLVRKFRKYYNIANPKKSYPYFNINSKKFIVPIRPEYHTELFPDSILRTESLDSFIENRPNRNAISKVYISRSRERNLRQGDVILFYRTKYQGSAYYTSVITTIGVIQEVIKNIDSEAKFVELCRKRSVFSDSELRRHWRYKISDRPFIVKFLYVYSFPKRMNRKALIDNGIIESTDSAPRGFEQINDEQFEKILNGSNTDGRIIVDQA